jgi:2-dehydro-3-deoxy-D-arabinonate dehydratase
MTVSLSALSSARVERRRDASGAVRWLSFVRDAVEPAVLADGVGLAQILRAGDLAGLIDDAVPGARWVDAAVLAPVDRDTEVWAAGVTYEQSRQARMDESVNPDIYDRVYDADRPELFFKSVGWRVRGPGQSISIRADSEWNVPEPELGVVLRPNGEVFGWTISNDVSSRTIEGDNPLYLPQAKVYLGACAVGPSVILAADVADPYDLDISLDIMRGGEVAWAGQSSTRLLRRRVDVLSEHLFRADVFPDGVVLSTGTPLVPESAFTLSPGDVVSIRIGELGELRNPTIVGKPPAEAAWS